MMEDQLFEIIDPVLKSSGALSEAGEEYRTPPLDVLRYYWRPVRLNRMPVLGRASSVVAVVRQPVDVAFRPDDYRTFLTRLAMAVNGRFPPWAWSRRRGLAITGGLVVGLTVLILTPEPIGPEDDATLAQVLGAGPGRPEAHPFGPPRAAPRQPRPGGARLHPRPRARRPLPGARGARRRPRPSPPPVRPVDGSLRGDPGRTVLGSRRVGRVLEAQQ